jgi:hypothetical protein
MKAVLARLPSAGVALPLSRDREGFARIGLTAAFAVLLAVMAAFHTPARDELQAWLIARESHSLPGLMLNMRNEGHPPLWQMLLMGVQWITGSAHPAMLTAFQWLIGTAAVSTILLRAPFPLWLSALVALNYFVLFEYGTVARSYGIGLLAVLGWLVAGNWRVRWLTIALLPHVSLHFALLGGVLAVMQWRDDRFALRGIGFAAASALLALWLLMPDRSTVSLVPVDGFDGKLITSIINFGSLAFPLTNYGGWRFLAADQTVLPFLLLAAVASLVAVAPLFGHDRGHFLLAAGLVVALFALSVFVYTCFARHFGVLVLLAIAVAWRDWELPRFSRRAFAAVSAWLAVIGVAAAVLTVRVPFSQHDRAAEWITAHGLAGQRWSAYPPHVQVEPAAWLGGATYDLVKDCLTTFPRWTYSDVPRTGDALFAGLLRRGLSRHGGELHLILEGEPLPSIAGIEAAELARFGGGAYAGAMRLYRLTETGPGERLTAPEACPNPYLMRQAQN